VNVPVDVPSEVFESAIVGLIVVLQHTPLSVIPAPPSEVTFPPPSAVEPDKVLILEVVTAGNEAITILKVLGELVPHELLAVTEIVPPLAPAVTEIDVELELPLHPEGNVHE
jgi:hypothetical protein